MTIAAPIQSHFDGGEVSPLVSGRVDSERYRSSLALCKNWIPLLQGALPRRPGTYYIGTTKSPDSRTRLIPFQFSTTQSYILEFGANYIRFYTDYGQVQVGGVAYEVSTPYAITDLQLLRYTQKEDVLYLVHPNYRPMKLERFGQTSWQLVPIYFTDGPYLPINTSQVTATPSATTGTNVLVTFGPTQTITNCVNNGSGLIRVTVTSHGWQTGQFIWVSGVTGTTEANGGWTITVIDANTFDLQGSTFTHAYVSGGSLVPTGSTNPNCSIDNYLIGDNALVPTSGSVIRLEQGSTWGWGYITGNPNPGVLSVNVQKPFGATTATASWRIGVWKFTAGGINCPGTVTFHEDRLTFSGTPSNPQRIDASNSSDYENFSPSGTDGTVVDSNALNFSLNANDVNYVQWLNSEEKGLMAGSVAAEWAIRPSVNGDAITPTNINAKRSTRWGSAAIQALQVGKATIHVQRGARRLRELMYFFDIDGWRDTDLSELAEHITGSGVVDMAFQSIPFPFMWLVRKDGALIGMTYDRDMMQLRVGWHWHTLGGQSDPTGTPPIIKSIAVIPSPDGTRDDLWMVVQRYINGSQVFTIEYLTKIFESIDDQNHAFFLDCGLTLDNPITVFGVTNANPAVVNAPNHGLSTGNSVRIDGVIGILSNGQSVLNGQTFVVTVVDSNHFQLNGIDTSASTAYYSGGEVRKLVTTISGLSYLQGETVNIYADGAEHPPQVVNSSGQITLEIPSAIVSIGYAYNSDGELLRLEAGSRNGTSLGKNRRIHRVGLLVDRSQGLEIGKDFNSLDTVQFRTQGVDNNGQATTLVSGIESHETDFDYDYDNKFCFRASGPFPCTVLAVMPMLETQDRA